MQKTEQHPLSSDEKRLVSGGTEHWLFEDCDGWQLVKIGGKRSGQVVRRFSSEDAGRRFIDENGITARERN